MELCAPAVENILVHISTVCNSERLQATEIPVSGRMDKWILVRLFKEIQYNSENEKKKGGACCIVRILMSIVLTQKHMSG